MNYEIRKINGQDVFIGKIASGFYLVNDVYLFVFEEFVLSDTNILFVLDCKKDIVYPYGGAAKDEVMALAESPISDKMLRMHYSLESLFPDNVVEAARSMYRKYVEWAKI